MTYFGVAKRVLRRRACLLTLTIGIGFTAATQTFTPESEAPVSTDRTLLQPTVLDKNITKVVINKIQKQHYNRVKLDDELSELLYRDYFSRLDPNHYYFLEADLEEFAGNKFILDDLLIMGDVNFAFAVYKRFLQRVSERVDYVRESVKQEFDFSKDESLVVDRTELPWATTAEELNEIWRKRVKNQLLIEQFLVEVAEDDAKADSDALSPQDKVIRKYEQFQKFYAENDNADVMEYYLTTVLNIFDPHSTYMNWRSYQDFNIAMKLELKGIGATLKYVDGYTEVVNLIPGGPADKDGRLQPGDKIIAVAQGNDPYVDVVDMPLNKVVRKIRGPIDTIVRLSTIKSLHSTPIEIILTRDKVKLQDQEAKGSVQTKEADTTQIDKNRGHKLGIVDIPTFYADFSGLKQGTKGAKSTSKDVKKLVEDMLQNDGIDGLLIDLRSNGGGSLQEAISLTGLFIPEGPVVQVRKRQGIRIESDNDDGFLFEVPLVVLMNRSSASASEIFSGAIKDHKRGVIVGDQTTHGKGTVQQVYPLNKLRILRDQKSGAIKFTMAKFYRVTGGSTQKKGVTPDIIFPSFLDHMEIGEAHLKHVMPWDEVDPLEIQQGIDVTKYLPELKKRLDQRLQNDSIFRELSDDIERYGVRKQQQSISLNKEQRIALKEEDEYWSKRLRSVLGKRSKTKDKDADESDTEAEEKMPDVYMDAALDILADLVDLTGRDQVAQRSQTEPAFEIK